MKLINKLFILSLSLTIGLSSCGIWDQPAFEEIGNENKEDQKENENDKEKEQPEVKTFEGYTFVLDQSSIPTLGGYGSEKEAPQAKLMAFDDKGELIKDVLAANGVNVDLGFDCSLQKVGDYFVIFAKSYSLKDVDDEVTQDASKKRLATVLEARTLKLVSQVGFEHQSNNFIVAASAEKAFIGANRGSNILTLDLKTGAITDFAPSHYDSWASGQIGVGYNGKLFVPINGKAALGVYDITMPGKMNEIILPGRRIKGLYKVSDEMLLVTLPEQVCLVSMKTNLIVKTVALEFKSLSMKSLVYDAKTERLYVSGTKKKENRDKIFFYDMTQESPAPQLLYTVPKEDINEWASFHGNIMMGFNHDKDEMYIGHLYTQEFVDRPNGGGKKAIRVGFLSKVTGLSSKTPPILAPDTKVKIEDMYEFSHFFHLGN